MLGFTKKMERSIFLIGALFFLACLAFPPVGCVPLNNSQGQILQELNIGWGRNFTGWEAGAECSTNGTLRHDVMDQISCNADGIVTSM
ncbi:unnamed protein product [Closterium sp. NIES-54]